MPTYKVTDPKTGKVMRLTGDSPPTQQELEEIFSQFEVKPERSFGEKAGGVVDAGLAMLSGAAAEPISGLYGLATLASTFDPERAARSQQQAAETLTTKPGALGQEYMQDVANLPIIKQAGEIMQSGAQQLGDAAYNVTGSPLAASVVKAAPEAFATYVGSRVPEGAANRFSNSLAEEQQAARSMADAEAVNADTKQMGKALAQGVKSPDVKAFKSIAEIIDSKPEFYAALDELGITEQPLASYGSNNPQFRGVEQAFAAMPTSPQHTQALRFSKSVSDLANALDKKYTTASGSVDASMRWRDAAMENINMLGEAADEAYSLLGEQLNKRAPANAINTQELIAEQTKNLALGKSDPDVDPVLKRVIASLEPRQIETETGVQIVPPTFENIDQLRKKVGAAAFKKEGEFKDADSASLKRVYAALTKDTEAMAEAQGLVDQVKAAKSLVAQRKAMEEKAQNILGKKLTKDIVPVIQQGIKGLANGGAQKYKELMRNIPQPEIRQELVYNAISDTFRQTIKGEKGQFNNTNYLKWYNDTLGNKAVRELMQKDLPEGALRDFDNLATISEGITKATSQKIPTGIVQAVLDDQMGFVQKMVKGGAKKVPGAAAFAVDAVMDLAEKNTDRARAASDLLADPRLQRIIASGYAQGKRADRLNKQVEVSLKKQEKYQKWVDTLSANEKRKLESVGLTQFLTATGEEQKPQK
jgi:hypothetical protein